MRQMIANITVTVNTASTISRTNTWSCAVARAAVVSALSIFATKKLAARKLVVAVVSREASCIQVRIQMKS